MDLQVIISMMIWICSFMGINPVTDLPSVEVVSPNMLSKVCKVDVPGCYQRPMIYLRNDLTPAQKEYVLAHELIHYKMPSFIKKSNWVDEFLTYKGEALYKR